MGGTAGTYCFSLTLSPGVLTVYPSHTLVPLSTDPLPGPEASGWEMLGKTLQGLFALGARRTGLHFPTSDINF